MKSLAAHAHEKIMEVCPISGLSMGSEKDKATWFPHYTEEATESQKRKAEKAIKAIDVEAFSKNNDVLSQIRVLEASATPRRIRECLLGSDNGWMKDLNAKIATLRGQLK